MDSAIADAVTGFPYSRLAEALPEGCDRLGMCAAFEAAIAGRLASTSPVRHPFLLNVSGIPCSGKSTYCGRLFSGRADCGLDVSGALFVSFDDIMEDDRLPYMSEAVADEERAFARWELPARIAGYELLRRAVEGRRDIVFEHSSALTRHVALFSSIKAEGYSFHFRYVAIRPEEAAWWLERRRTRSGRAIREYIFRRYEALAALLPEYERMADTFQTIEQCGVEK